MKEYLIELLQYLKNPYIVKNVGNDLHIAFLLKSLLFIILIKLICLLVVFILKKLQYFNMRKFNLDDWYEKTGKYTFVQVALIAPILEEVMFRGVLSNSIYSFILSIAVLAYFGVKRYYKTPFYSVDDAFFIAIAISLIVSCAIYFVCKEMELEVLYHKLYMNKYSIICLIVVNSLLFALWHLSNFQYNSNKYLSLIVTLLPHFISGILYSIICVQFGIIYSIVLHIMVNSIPVFLVVFEKYYFAQKQKTLQ